jgi:hypothetical protein
MRCLSHKSEAIGICSYCGRAVCDECAHAIQAERITCSEHCATALRRNEVALQAMLRQGKQNAKASAFYCYLCGGLSAIAAVTAWFMLPSPFLILFTGGCAVVLTASGVWYGRIADDKSALSLGMPSQSGKSADPPGFRGPAAPDSLGAAVH